MGSGVACLALCRPAPVRRKRQHRDLAERPGFHITHGRCQSQSSLPDPGSATQDRRILSNVPRAKRDGGGGGPTATYIRALIWRLEGTHCASSRASQNMHKTQVFCTIVTDYAKRMDKTTHFQKTSIFSKNSVLCDDGGPTAPLPLTLFVQHAEARAIPHITRASH